MSKLKPIKCWAIYDGRKMLNVDHRLELYWTRKEALNDIKDSGIEDGVTVVRGTFVPESK